MKRRYIAVRENCESIIGSIEDISIELKCTRQAVSKAYRNATFCKGYNIHFYNFNQPNVKLTQKDRFRNALDLIKRCRLIIDENNEILSNNGKYSNISIVKDIDNFLNENETANEQSNNKRQ